MKRFAIGLSAALAVAILIPAAVISAPKEEKGKPAAIDAKSREIGKKEAPAIMAASGAGCTVSDARYIGDPDLDSNGSRVGLAQERYVNGKVIKPVPATASKIGAVGAGDGAGMGAETK